MSISLLASTTRSSTFSSTFSAKSLLYRSHQKGSLFQRKRFFTEETKKGNSVDQQKENLPGGIEFKKLGLSEVVVNALAASHPHITQPTPIQNTGIPVQIRRKADVVLASHAGSGKTLAYLLPLIHNIKEAELREHVETKPQRPRAVVLVPNRELCTQTLRVAKQLSHVAKFRSVEVIGGEKWSGQKDTLETKVDIVFATPQRFLQHKEKGNLFLTQVRHLVIDEADTMLAKDFLTDIDTLLRMLQTRRMKDTESELLVQHPLQTVIVTAALTDKLEKEVDKRFPDIRKIRTTSLHKSVSALKHEFVAFGVDKMAALIEVLKRRPPKHTMIFCNTVDSCRAVEHHLREKGFSTTCFHGDMPFEERESQWERFVNKKSPILVCTDIGSRGLDTVFVDHVLQFDFPLNPIDYIHRVGRTARIGGSGTATSLIGKRDRVLATGIKTAIDHGLSLEKLTASKKDYTPEGLLKQIAEEIKAKKSASHTK